MLLDWAGQFATILTRHCAAAGGTNAGNLRRLVNGGLSLILLTLPLYAQQSGPVSTPQPNCLLQFQLPQSGQTVAPFNSPNFDNRFVGCSSFFLSVQVPTTISALSLVVQTAPDNGSGAPGTWSTFTAATGSNPNTLTTGWTATFSTGTSAYFAWLRVQLTSKTGTGQVTGKLFSSIAGGGSGSGGGGCVGTSATPCVVDGPTAVGSAPTTPPVLVAGMDASLIRVLRTNAFGGIVPGSTVSISLADGQANSVVEPGVTDNATGFLEAPIYVPYPYLFDGNTWDRARGGSGTDNLGVTTTTLGVQKVMEMMADPTGAAGSVIQMASVRGATATGGSAANALQTGQLVYNGATFDLSYACTNRATIALTTIGLTRIITGTSAKKIRLCSLSMSFASPVDIQVVEGTQAVTACDTGATNMTGLYRSVVGFDPNLSNLFALTEATNADDVCISMSASVNGGGTAIYAVF
jgi:hypothetical protein